MKGNWKKEFNNTKLIKMGGSCFECCDYESTVDDMKDFIHQTLQQERQRWVVELDKKMVKNIGRQPYSSVDREYLQFNQGLQTAINLINGEKE